MSALVIDKLMNESISYFFRVASNKSTHTCTRSAYTHIEGCLGFGAHLVARDCNTHMQGGHLNFAADVVVSVVSGVCVKNTE